MKAWTSVYYKLKILPSLVFQQPWGGGDIHMHACCPKRNSWRVKGWERIPHHCRKKQQVENKIRCVVFVLYICLSIYVLYMIGPMCKRVQKSILFMHVHNRSTPVPFAKAPVSHTACVSGWAQVWIVLFMLSNLFKSQLRECYESKLMTVLFMLMLKLWYEYCIGHSWQQLPH